MTTIGSIGSLGGEFAFIDRIARGVGNLGGNALRVGIGDDAAVLHVSGDDDLIVTTDLLIQDVHFRLSYGDPYSLGVKAAAVNLSDIAAMGATPTTAFISLAVPHDTNVAFLDEMYRGMNEIFGTYGAHIAGGDTNLSPGPLTVNVTLLGTIPTGKAILRSTARVGDVVLVTGKLGAAAAGFHLLEQLGRDGAEAISTDAVRAQLRPIPRIGEGLLLRGSGLASSMMDLSDGLMGDLAKLCRASGVSAWIERDAAPIASSAQIASAMLHKNAIDLALRGGEDYELLLTASLADAVTIDGMLQMATGVGATVVGRITEGNVGTVALYDADNTPVAAPDSWDHFAA